MKMVVLVSPLFSVLLLLCFVESFCGEGYGKEPQPKIPAMPKKEDKHENKKDIRETFSACYQGYRLRNDKKCVKEIIEEPMHLSNVVAVPYLHRCPDGYEEEKKKNVCSTTVEVPPEYYCPTGWTDNVNDCITTEAPGYTLECPKGKRWELINGRCIISHKAKPIVSSRCPEGTEVERDGHCWKVIGSYDCTPEKKEKDKKKEGKKRDHKEEKLRQLGEKDEGKKQDKEEKHKVEVLKEMELVTPPRSTKVGVVSRQCERKVLVEPIVLVSCPDGFIDAGNGECWNEEVAAPERVCDSKDKKNGSDCLPQQRSTPKVAKCPAGTEKVKENCVRTTLVPLVNVCPSGWTDSGEGCIGTLDNVPLLECRPGLKLVDDKCIGELVRPAIGLTLKVPAECESKNY